MIETHMAYGDKKFKELFLPHEQCLKSVGDLIAFIYHPHKFSVRVMVDGLPKSRINLQRVVDEATTSRAIRNIKNAWYYEQLLAEMLNNKSLFQFSTPINISIIYHGVFNALSALTCIVNPNILEGSASPKFSAFNNILLQSPTYSQYLAFPFNFLLNMKTGKIIPSWKKIVDWDYGLESHCPVIESTLKQIKGRGYVSLLDYLRYLREFIQYQEAQLATFLYGKSVIENLEFSLQKILVFFISNVEVFYGLSIPNGFEKLEEEAALFAKPLKSNFGIELKGPLERAHVYKNVGLPAVR